MTTAASMTPGSRPRRGAIGALALLGVGLLTTALVLAAGETGTPSKVAGAVELSTFSSCDDLAAWGSGAMDPGAGRAEESFDAVGGDMAEADAPTAAPSDGGAPSTTAVAVDGAEGAASGGPAVDETNVAVEGVDEIDLVDRLTEDVVLVTSSGRLAVVDLVAAEVVAATAVPWDAQITYDAEAGVAWVVGHGDSGGVVVERVAVDVAGLEPEGSWTTTGSLVDARRVGDELHVVATEGFATPAFDGAGGLPPADPSAVPFADGPVACDEVLHPEGPSDPTATLLVTLPATGEVDPVRAAEVVGSGSLVHVTTGSIYLATPQWHPDGSTTTGIHRFEAATLEPTGSGQVEGSLLDELSMSEHDRFLRVAVTQGGGVRAFGGDVGVAVDVAPAAPETTEPEMTEPDVVEPETTTAPDGRESSEPPLTTVVTEPLPPPPPGPEGPALNEIVVLDTDGALDVVGRTEPFGHPGETLHGVRFAGTTAYAVTFLQTDPFYVVDLADPSAPQVLGEVELPGFSSYLHPLGGGLVVGFGPGGDGRAAAKLFDVSDPTAPAVVGELVLGDESAVSVDHHAYLDLGDGRFAVPATSYGVAEEVAPDAGPGDTWAGLAGEVVVVDTAGGELVEVARHAVSTSEPATRVLSVGDGWALLAGPEIVVLDGAGHPTGRVTL
ncbi:hypothetical protein HC251_20465 [Iamia sp. SCSIO 61187]|uniref:beta-propeller domain-containing protein n=1 Tax=Iamia sp. SCSIO 61187 TaxID=2722752 RepID=UPI001C631BB4|nr:beta-propeller domain-containing protein [Iamia sp. SCSIO 61187]QYG94571.1 hypothetical protein HC251_20465 [Iamia sp. SCSIO 61187]